MSAPTAVGVGAEQGLGAALCRRLAREGYHVLVAGRTAEKIDQVVRTIAGTGGVAEAIVTDATKETDVVELFDRAFSPAAERGADGLLGIDAIAETDWHIHRQHPSAWTQEVDLRPFKESF